jgi:hypothetical protein
MPLEAIWRPHGLVSVLHAAEAASRKQPLADLRLSAAIELPARQLAAEIRAANLPVDRFWSHLIPLAANIAGRRQLVETAVTKTMGRGPGWEAIVANLDACLAAVDSAAKVVLPNLDAELALRERPLREQWEARGAGLLHQIGCLTEESLIAPQCTVLLVHPALGGGGEAHLAYNSVRIEAVLANPVAELPEVIRLAWLIAQLQLDLPAISESIHADRLPHVARYAMLPPTLIAAEAVELIRFAPEELRRAIAAWGLVSPPGVDAAELVSQWWQTYQESRPPWNIALAALDQMFG